MARPNPLESRLGLTQQIVRRNNPHVDRVGIPATKMMTTLLDIRDDDSFPFHGKKRRVRSRKKESRLASLELDAIHADNIPTTELPSPMHQQSTNMSISDNDLSKTGLGSTVSRLFSGMNQIQLVEKGKV